MLAGLEGSLSWSGVIQILITLFGFVGAFYAIKNDVLEVKRDVEHLQDTQRALTEAFKQLGTIITQIAVQDTRIKSIERRIDELRHGHNLLIKNYGKVPE